MRPRRPVLLLCIGCGLLLPNSVGSGAPHHRAQPGRRDPLAAAEARLLGLCIGVSEYRHPSKFAPVPYAGADADVLADAVQHQKSLYAHAKTTVLKDRAATRKEIRQALKALEHEVAPADTVLVFLRGRGVDQGSDYWFCPYDADPEDIEGTTIRWRGLIEALRAVSARSRRVVVLLDTDHSGRATLPDAVAAQSGGIALILAGTPGGTQDIATSEWRGGAFARALSEVMTDPARFAGERSLSLTDLVNAVQLRVSELTGARQLPWLRWAMRLDASAPLFGVATPSSRTGSPAVFFARPQDGDSVTNTVSFTFDATSQLEVDNHPGFYANGVPVLSQPQMAGAIVVPAKDPVAPRHGPIVVTAKWRRDTRVQPTSRGSGKLFTGTEVPLPERKGPVSLRAIVHDAQAGRGDAVVTVENAPSGSGRGDLYLLFVGISGTDESQRRGAAGSAPRFGEALGSLAQSQQGSRYEKVHVQLLTDAAATVQNVRSAFQHFIGAGPSDTVLVILSGQYAATSAHSSGIRLFGREAGDVEPTGLSWDELVASLSSFPSTRILAMNLAPSGPGPESPEPFVAARRAGMILLKSGAVKEPPAVDGTGTPLFLSAVLEGLQGRADLNRDGAVSVPEEAVYVRERVVELTQGRQHPQALWQDLDPGLVLTRVR